MTRTTPRRLRDSIVADQEKALRKRRPLLIIAITLLVLVVGALGYSFIAHTFLQPPVESTVEQTDLYVKAGEHIQVDVVNACGVNGVAQKFTAFLRARRFDVPEYSTSAGRERRSHVIDRVGDHLSAQKVAYALGIPAERIVVQIDSSLYLRATVVIGEDYKSLRPGKQ